MRKNFLNRVTSLMLSVLVILSMTVPIAASAEGETSDFDYTKITAVFRSAGLLDQNEISSADLSSILTRAEFADYMAKLLNTKSEESSIIYIDVPTGNLYTKGINGLAKSGILSVPDDLMFNPDMPISYDEALTMIVRATGYGVMAQAHGGFPTGYRYAASRLGIKVDTASEETLTMGEGLRMLFEGATVGTYSPDTVTGEGASSFKVTEETLLSLYHNICLQEGKLYAYRGASIGDYKTEDNEANVDGLIYECSDDINADDLLGNNVEIFYQLDSKKENASLIYIEKSVGDDELVIDAENIRSFNSQSFTIDYVKDSSSNKKLSVTVPRSINVVYNGRVNGASLSGLINSLKTGYNHGSICLKDTDSNAGYDLMIIKCYRTMALTGYSSETMYDALNANENVCTEDYKHITIHTPEGLAAKIHTGFPYIVDVAMSADKEKLEVVICSEKASGVLSAVNASNTSVKLGDTEHTVNENYFTQNSSKFYPGTEYTAYMNSKGEISYVVEGATVDYKIGYLLKAGYEEGVFGTSINFRIFDHSAGAFETYTTGNKLYIDGEKYDMDKDIKNVIKAFPDLTGQVSTETTKIVPQLIRYKADENKVITDIDTAALSAKESDDNSLQRIRTMSVKAVDYTGWYKRFDLSMVYNSSNTKVVVIPALDNDGNMTINGQKTSDVEKYFSTSSSELTADANKEMYGYNFDGTTPYADVLVYVGSSDSKNKRTMMFKEFGEGLDGDGRRVKTLIVNDTGSETVFTINQNTTIPEGLTEGDLISIDQGSDGSATKIYLMYDRETMKYKDGSRAYGDYGDYVYNLPGYFTGYAYRSVGRQLSRGYIYKKIGTFVQLTYVLGDAAFDGAGYECMDISGRTVIMYDSSARDGAKITTGTTNDIVDYKSAGSACTYMIVSSYNGDPGAVFIYK